MNSKVYLLPVALIALGCGAAGSGGQLSGSGGSGGSGSAASSSAGTGQGGESGGIDPSGSGTGSGSGDGCSDAAKLIYVLSEDNDLYSFQPALKQFKKIGPLGCQPPATMRPNSMAVDRNAVAWVNYVEIDGFGDATDGAIFKVNTADASCQPSSIALEEGWYWIGMGFSTEVVGGSSETLFIAGTGKSGIFSGTDPGLGKIDFSANRVSSIGEFTGSIFGERAELTGTGDARLFGFFTTTPVQVAELDKTSGLAKSTRELPDVETPFSFAFSFWGGDFYLYTAPKDETVTTTVSRYRPSDGSVDAAYMTNIGFRIIGAGVSTCAPVEPPR